MKYGLLWPALIMGALVACQPLAGPGGANGASRPAARQGDGAATEGGYTSFFSHQMPDDYVMRSGLAPSDESSGQGGLLDFFGRPASSREVQAKSGNGMSPEQERHRQAVALTEKVAVLAGELVAMGREHLEPEEALTVSTFVNLGDLYRTSSLGRLLGEQLISSLKKAGYSVIEVRKPAAILIKERFGEYGLSRDMEELAFVHQARAMVVGTYNRAAGQVFVNARLLNSEDGLVLAAASVVLEEDAFVADLLRDEAAPVVSRPTSRIEVTGQ